MKKIQLQIMGAESFAVRQAYKDIRTNLGFSQHNMKTLAITSTKEDEGKTSVALNLARSEAELGKKVILLDADLRDSEMESFADQQINGGLCEILEGELAWSDCVCSTQYGFDVIFAGKSTIKPLELLDSAALAALMEELRSAYDMVIADTSSSGLALDAAVVGALCDGVAVVVGNNNVKYDDLKANLTRLKKNNNNVIGIIRNNPIAKKK